MYSRFEGSANTDFTEYNGAVLVQFKNLKKYDDVITHCFTTRVGGVSTGECESLNMGFNRKDTRENVLKNYEKVADALGVNCSDMVLSNQIHENHVRKVTAQDRGKGIVKSSDIIGFDGLVTNERGVALVTFYADCVPLFFFDPEKRVIALSHSGWRGTVKQIAAETVKKMFNEYGCEPAGIEAAIGPSIGKCCFEVGEEVYEEFLEKLPWSSMYCDKTGPGKWHVNMQQIIRKTMIHSGLNKDRISVAGICTKCNNDVFFSHRGDGGKTGSLAAVMQIR